MEHIHPRTRRQRVADRDQLKEEVNTLLLRVLLRVIGSCSNQEIIKHRIWQTPRDRSLLSFHRVSFNVPGGIPFHRGIRFPGTGQMKPCCHLLFPLSSFHFHSNHPPSKPTVTFQLIKLFKEPLVRILHQCFYRFIMHEMKCLIKKSFHLLI